VFARAVNEQTLFEVPELVGRLRALKETLGPVKSAFEVSSAARIPLE